ncbi:MAG: hypothetical protein AAB770_00540 [Patescibacteria group bacterium]
MDTEETTQSGGGKKFLTIALVAVLVVAGVLFVKKWYTPQTEVKTAIIEKRVYTHEERMKILTDLAQAIPKDTTSQVEKMRILSAIAKRAPADTVTTTAEKLKILEALAENAR